MNYPRMEGRVLGVDLSHWQHQVDFKELGSAEIGFAFLKATEGLSWIDKKFYQRTAQSLRGIVWPGSYHYLTSAKDPYRQAAHYARTAESSCWLRPVCDFEEAKAGTAKAATNALAFCRATTKLWGCKTILYSYSYFLDQMAERAPHVMRELAEETDLWVADYRGGDPWVPEPFQRWKLHQFDGDGGLVMSNGVDADFNWYQGTLQEFSEDIVR